MFEFNWVQVGQPRLFAARDLGPRRTASMLAGSNWSYWSKLFIELVETVLRRLQHRANPHRHRVLLNCQNFLVQWDHLDLANRHTGFSRPASYSAGRNTWTNSAPQVLNQLLCRQLATTLRRAHAIDFGQQRSRAGRPARSEAPCAHGSATNTTACLTRCSVISVSGESGVPLSPGCTMSRLAGASPPAASLRGLDTGKWQRGHVGPPVAALGGNPTSPLCFVRCSVMPVSGHGGVPPCPGTTRLSRSVRGSCGARPLRQSYITPHCPQCPPVSRKLLLWQPPPRALRVKATGVMQNCLRWSGRIAVGAPRAPRRPTRHRLAPSWLLWHLGLGQALRAVFWSVACGQSCCVCPRPPLGACRFAALAPRRTARPPPQGGSLSPRSSASVSRSPTLNPESTYHA